MTEQNYVVGRGRLYFNKYPDSQTPVGDGERYFGNTPSLQLTQANTDLKHYSSEAGLKVLDRSVTLQKDMSGTFATDNIDPANLALWYAGNLSDAAQAAASGLSESFDVQPDLWYQIGVTNANPLGLTDLATMTAVAVVAIAATGTVTFAAQPSVADTVTINGDVLTFVAGGATGPQINLGGNPAGTAQNLATYINANPGTMGVVSTGASNVLTLTAVVAGTAGNALTLAKSATNPTVSGATLSGGLAGTSEALVQGTDWDAEIDTGRFQILLDGGVVANSVVTVTYATAVADSAVIVTSDTELYGSLRFISDNPVGNQTDYFWPFVKMTASGNYALKGDTWQEMTFAFDVLKLDTRERAYLRQRAS